MLPAYLPDIDFSKVPVLSEADLIAFELRFLLEADFMHYAWRPGMKYGEPHTPSLAECIAQHKQTKQE